MSRLIFGIICIMGLGFFTNSLAHEMTPTYFKVGPSHMDTIYRTKITVYNRREDVQYYEIGVFDTDFNPVPFTSLYKIVKIDYLTKVNIDVYFKADMVNKVVYICSKSKLRKSVKRLTAVSSRICSKAK